jgi:hypothetical protein
MCLLAACNPTAFQSPIPTLESSPWGTVHRLAFAEYPSAPAVVENGTTMFAWAGADPQEARLYAQSADAAKPTILALKASAPLDLQLYPAANDRFHLLWRDDVEGSPHLFYGLFNADRVAEWGAYDVSEQSTYNITAHSLADGRLRVVYSAGWVVEPRLFVQDIDERGRSQFPVPLDQAGDFPAFLAYDDTLWLFWQAEDGVVWQGVLEGNTLIEPQSIMLTPALAAGDAIMQLTVSGDATYRYLFWQVVRADGSPETWYAVGEKTGLTWSPAMRLTIPTLGDSTTRTGYQVGDVLAAERGAEVVGWSAPLLGVQPIVPIAVQTGDALGIAYLQAGNIMGYQRLVSVGPMIGRPSLALRPDRSLVLAWSQPDVNASALNWIASQ